MSGDSHSTASDEAGDGVEEEEASSCSTEARLTAWDLTALLVANGVSCPRLQNGLVLVHSRVVQAVPGYLEPGLSVLLQAAQLTVQLWQSGEEDIRALALAVEQGYVRCHGSPDLQRQVQQVVDAALEDIRRDVYRTGGVWPPLSAMVIRTNSLQQHTSETVYMRQTVHYIRSLLVNNNTEDMRVWWRRAPLPLVEDFPKFDAAPAEILTLVLASVPMQSWPQLHNACKLMLRDINGGADVIAKVGRMVAAKKNGKCNDGMSVLVRDEECMADPRFNASPVLCEEGVTLQEVTTVANKISLGIWRMLKSHPEETKTKKHGELVSKKSFENYSLLEISQAIYEKKLMKNYAPHPSVPHLYPLFIQLDKFFINFSESSDSTLFTDQEWQKLVAALRWKDRLKELCSISVTKSSFSLFLPKLVLHWQFVNDELLKSIAQFGHVSQECYDKLQRSAAKLTSIFASNCGVVHEVAEDLGEHMMHPKPYSSEESAHVQTKLLKLALAMRPDLKEEAQNIFLASEECRKAKTQLVAIAVDSQNNKSDSSELLSRLIDLEAAINVATASSNKNSSDLQNHKLCLLNIQSWPLIDYIVSQRVNWSFIEGSVNSSQLRRDQIVELVSHCVSMPLEVLETGRGHQGWVSAHLSAIDSNTAASRNTQYWSTYPRVLKTDDDNEEVKIVNKVYSPVQCLLTHLLSTGTADEALQELKVGVHAEKATQLYRIRETLWNNWQNLSDPSLSPKVMFVKCVSQFSEELFHSLAKVFDTESSSTDETVRLLLGPIGEKCGASCAPLLSEIEAYSASHPSADIVTVARLGTAVGALQGWLAGHMEAMDPAEKRKLLLHYKEHDVERIKQEILQHSWTNILKGGKPLYQECSGVTEHPHLSIRREELKSASSAVSSLSQDVAYRPEEVEYIRLTEDVAHFISTAFNPAVIGTLISDLSEENVLLMTTEQIDRKLITFDNFFHHIHKEYPLFRDVTSLFLQGLAMTTRSLRVLNARVKLKLVDVSCTRDVTQLLMSLTSFPIVRDHNKPLEYLHRLKKDVNELSSVFSANEGSVRITSKCQSLSLRSSLLELYTHCVAAGRMDHSASVLLTDIVDKALNWWRKQEEEKKRKEEEEASLFKYKAREHAKNETEEETIAREFAKTFPSYDKDFDDLKDSTLEMEVEEAPLDETDDDAVEEEWLTERQLWEISEVHCDLLSKLPYSPLQSSVKTAKSDAIKNFGPIPAALQRVKILQTVMNACGPIADCDLDSATIGAHLIFNHTACVSWRDPQTTEILMKPENFYVDPRPSEAAKLRPLLLPLLKRIDFLLLQWPEHPSLLLVSRVAERVLEYPITSPLAKLLAGLESILLKSEIWQANAHRGVSLGGEYDPDSEKNDNLVLIKKQVVEWRKIELQEWKNCLDLVTYTESLNSKMKWWPHFYDCLTKEDWNTNSIGILAEILKDLMENSTLGDYEAKLMLIHVFYRHLILSKSPNSSQVLCLTWNVYHYYCQFLPVIKTALDKERKEIETKVKDVVKVANYSIATFRDINQVREKINKCCQTLHSSMRRWKKFLMTQDRDIWAKDSGDELKDHQGGVWDAAAVSTTIASVLPPAVLQAENIDCAVDGSVLRSISSYSLKAHKFVLKVIESLPYSDCVESIEDITGSIIESYHKLSTDASIGAQETDKDVRLTKLKNVMQMRRVSVTRLFQQLNEMGVKYIKGNNLWKKDELTRCYLVPPCDLEALALDERTLTALRELWPGCDKYFYRSINRFKLLDDKLAAPHDDLGPELIKRVRGASRHLMLLSVVVRKQMSYLVENLHKLRCFVDDIESAPANPIASATAISAIWQKLHSYSLSLSLTAGEVRAVIYTKLDKAIDSRLEDDACLVPSQDTNKSLNNVSLIEARELLGCVETQCSAIARKSGQMRAAFVDETWPRIVSESHVELVGDLNQQLTAVAETVTKAVSYVDPNHDGYLCLTRELVNWLGKWTTTSKDIVTWLRVACSDEPSTKDYALLSSVNILKLENCTSAVLYAVQTSYKKHATDNADNDESEVINGWMVNSVIRDMKSMNLNYVLNCLKSLVTEVSEGNNEELQSSLTQMSSLLLQYACLGENVLLSAAAGSRSISKLLSVLLAIFYQMANNGFCKPEDLDEQAGGEGKLSFEDDDTEAAGLADGEGKKDMSDKLESEDQLESALQEGEKEKPGDKDLEEDNGVEMSNDFEGKLQDLDKPEQNEDDEEDDPDKEKDALDQIGQTEQGADTLDKKLWNEQDEDNDENQETGDMEEEENAQGNENEMESQIVAKEKNKKDKKKDDRDDAQEKADKPEEMPEDRRQPNKPTEEEEDLDDDFVDKLAGEDEKQKENETEAEDAIDIPDDLNIDEGEENRDDKKDGEEEGENGEEVNPLDIEKKGLFPEGKDLEDENDNEEGKEDMDDLPEEENENKDNEDEDGEKNPDEMEGTDKDFDADVIDDDQNDEKEKEQKKNAGMQEGDDNEKRPEPEEDEKADVEASKDKDTKNDAEAAQIEAKNASKDKTKQAPKPEDAGKQFDEEDEQEDTGEAGETTQEKLGVGQSQSQPQDDDMHKGEESAVTTDTKDSNSNQDQKQKRKPGQLDEDKITGNPDKDVRKGLMTNKKKDLQKNPEDGDEDQDDNNDNEEKDMSKDASLWQTVKKADDHHDGQVVDAGTRDQAVEAPAPVQEDEADQPEEEGVVQELMEVDEPEDAAAEPVPEKEASKIQNAGREHRQGDQSDATKDEAAEDEEAKIETEGEAVLEHTVQRPPETYFHTLLEQEELTAEAVFDEDVAATRGRLLDSASRLQRPTDAACHAWAKHQATIAPYAAQLCDQLRLILAPTEAARLKGDYKTGKRLNMRKVIGYIASHFLKDKIWLRRTQPSKRTYHVLLAVDDSESMAEAQAQDLAKQSISLVTQALTKLEVGKVGVLSFGSQTTLLHSLDDAFSDASGAKIFANLNFDQRETRLLDLLESSVAMFKHARGGAVAHSDTAQILIIISDGQTQARAERLKAAVRAARNDRVFVVFFVLDVSATHSFYDVQVWDGVNMTLKPLAEEFPFPYYLVVRDLSTLPHVLAEALRRWFELVTADATH